MLVLLLLLHVLLLLALLILFFFMVPAPPLLYTLSLHDALPISLAERARAGVQVHVLVDWLGGNKMEERLITLMEAAGVEFRKYRPLRWYNLHRLNNRTHRKLLVVDGMTGFTGGVGIRGGWDGAR